MREFNWMERVMDNHLLPRWLRALFGIGIVMAVCTIMAWIVTVFSIPFAVVTGTASYYVGAGGFAIWYFIFWKLIGWSDEIKLKELERGQV